MKYLDGKKQVDQMFKQVAKGLIVTMVYVLLISCVVYLRTVNMDIDRFSFYLSFNLDTSYIGLVNN